jgi:hypothetical protein
MMPRSPDDVLADDSGPNRDAFQRRRVLADDSDPNDAALG